MLKFEDNLASRVSGALQPMLGVQVTVTASNGLLATLYADDESTVLLNPLETDTNGYFGFKAANGEYSLTFAGAQIETSARKIELYDADDDPPLTLAQAAGVTGAERIGGTWFGGGVATVSQLGSSLGASLVGHGEASVADALDGFTSPAGAEKIGLSFGGANYLPGLNLAKWLQSEGVILSARHFSNIHDAQAESDRVNKSIVCYEEGTWQVSQPLHLRRGLSGFARDSRNLRLLKTAQENFIVLYPQGRVYQNFQVDAGGFDTAVDVAHDAPGLTSKGGIRYSHLSNISVDRARLRAFNFNGDTFGAMLNQLRVYMQHTPDGGVTWTSADCTAFYLVPEIDLGIAVLHAGVTNAGVAFIGPACYSPVGKGLNTTFLNATRTHIDIVGAEVAVDRFFELNNSTCRIAGTFEFASKHSTLFNSSLVMPLASMSTTRDSAETWTSKSNVPYTSAESRHLFRLIGDSSNLVIEQGELLNNIGRDGGTAGPVGICAVDGTNAHVRVGPIKQSYAVGGVSNYPPVQCKSQSSMSAARTLIGTSRRMLTASKTASATVALAETGNERFYVQENATVRYTVAQVKSGTAVTAHEWRMQVFSADGTSLSTHTLVAVAASATGAIRGSEINIPIRTGQYVQIYTSANIPAGATVTCSIVVDND